MNLFLRLVLRILQFSVVRKMDYANVKMRLHSVIDIQRLSSAKKEPETVQWIERHMKADSVFFDVGANVGAYSLVAAHVAPGQIFAFEPLYATYATLQENILLNGFSNITPMQFALGDKAGFVQIYPSTLKSGGAQHSYSKGKHVLRLATIDMDTLISVFKVPQPTMVKIDVDGYELPVIRGMFNAIANPALSTLLVELDATSGKDVLDILGSAGFKLVSKTQRGGGISHNCIFER